MIAQRCNCFWDAGWHFVNRLKQRLWPYNQDPEDCRLCEWWRSSLPSGCRAGGLRRAKGVCYDLNGISYWRLAVMWCRWLALVLFSVFVVGQSPAHAQDGQASNLIPPSVSTSSVAKDAPVITIDGLCGDDSAGGDKPAATPRTEDAANPVASCKTVITRERFDRIADAINPMMKPRIKFGFAKVFPETMLFAQKAHELGLDKDPNFQELMKWKYLQAESALFTKYVKDRSDKISDAEVERYYKEHPEMFEQVDLMRVFIPRQKGEMSPPGIQPKANPAEEAEMKAEADKIQKKAVAGGDFEKLEEEVYKVVNDPDNAPDVHVGKMTRDQVPPQYQKALFALQAGQVSAVIPGAEGWHVFKVISRRTVPLSEAKPIVQKLQVKDFTETLKSSIKSQFNDDYFGAEVNQAPGSEMDDMQ
jgi:hypothetical protein